MQNFNGYYTHQSYLKKELDNLVSGSIVLELGIGEGSSSLMYEFCKNNPHITVHSFETNLEWFDQMFEKYGNLPNYIFNLIDNWDNFEKYLDSNTHQYNLIFVDQTPWEARINSIDKLKDITETFILHDYDFFNKNENSWVKDACNDIYINNETSWLGQKYSEEFFMEDNYDILPPTLIMRKK